MGWLECQPLFSRFGPEKRGWQLLRFEKMTLKAQEAVQAAQEVAARHENQQIEPIHLLAALVAQADGVVPPLLARLGVRPRRCRRRLNGRSADCQRCKVLPSRHMGRPLERIYWNARSGSRHFKDEYVSTGASVSGYRAQDRDPAGAIVKAPGRHTRSHSSSSDGSARERSGVTSQNPEATYASSKIYGARPDGTGAQIRARPGHRRDARICTRVRICASRPMTGSSFDLRASSVRSRHIFEGCVVASGFCEVTRCVPRTPSELEEWLRVWRLALLTIACGVAILRGDSQKQMLGRKYSSLKCLLP